MELENGMKGSQWITSNPIPNNLGPYQEVRNLYAVGQQMNDTTGGEGLLTKKIYTMLIVCCGILR